jgi:riboflavin kinase/FMN adenylyltransferase
LSGMCMKVIRDISRLRGHGESVVTVGSFDGVHLGHRRILSEVAMLARGLSVVGVAVTFDPHPMAVLHPEEAPCLLTTAAERVGLMRETGVREAVVLRFTAKLAARPAEWFVRTILLERLSMRRLVIGYDFRFGVSREGDAPYLEHMGERLGFGVDIVPPVNYLDHPVSSTRVRTALVRGDVEAAASMLGRPYRFTGKVVKGKGIGRTLDFPTANLKMVEPEKTLPANGVYAVRVGVDKAEAAGALYIGPRPTFGGRTNSIEVHLIGFEGSLYGRRVRVSLLKRIRGDVAFAGPGDLREAIREDVGRVKSLLST